MDGSTCLHSSLPPLSACTDTCSCAVSFGGEMGPSFNPSSTPHPTPDTYSSSANAAGLNADSMNEVDVDERPLTCAVIPLRSAFTARSGTRQHPLALAWLESQGVMQGVLVAV